MANLSSNLKSIIAEQLNLSVDEVTDTANLREYLKLDKTRRSSFTEALGQRFDISITDEDTDQFVTTQDDFRYVETKLWWYSL